jgi:hypothetical protein
MEPSMWHRSVIQWKAAYGPQVKECVCPKRENKIEYGKEISGYLACVTETSRQKTI